MLHYENLQHYLRIGLKIKTIHGLLEFNQPQWLKPYIDVKTQERIEAEKMNTNKEKHCTN